jgi:hypothetical protein
MPFREKPYIVKHNAQSVCCHERIARRETANAGSIPNQHIAGVHCFSRTDVAYRVVNQGPYTENIFLRQPSKQNLSAVFRDSVKVHMACPKKIKVSRQFSGPENDLIRFVFVASGCCEYSFALLFGQAPTESSSWA